VFREGVPWLNTVGLTVVSHRRLNVSDFLMSSLLFFTVCLLLGGHLARQVHGTGLASQGFLVRCNTGSRVVSVVGK
jgi:hypothetical protein